MIIDLNYWISCCELRRLSFEICYGYLGFFDQDGSSRAERSSRPSDLHCLISGNNVLCSTGLWSGSDPADPGWTLISYRRKAKGRSAFLLHGIRRSPASGQVRSELRTLRNPLEEQEDKLAKVSAQNCPFKKKKYSRKVFSFCDIFNKPWCSLILFLRQCSFRSSYRLPNRHNSISRCVLAIICEIVHNVHVAIRK